MMSRVMTEKVATSRKNAKVALDAYYLCGGMDEDESTAIGDLIADLLHLAEDRGTLPSEMDSFVERALNHYAYESDPENANEAA